MLITLIKLLNLFVRVPFKNVPIYFVIFKLKIYFLVERMKLDKQLLNESEQISLILKMT